MVADQEKEGFVSREFPGQPDGMTKSPGLLLGKKPDLGGILPRRFREDRLVRSRKVAE